MGLAVAGLGIAGGLAAGAGTYGSMMMQSNIAGYQAGVQGYTAALLARQQTQTAQAAQTAMEMKGKEWASKIGARVASFGAGNISMTPGSSAKQVQTAMKGSAVEETAITGQKYYQVAQEQGAQEWSALATQQQDLYAQKQLAALAPVSALGAAAGPMISGIGAAGSLGTMGVGMFG